MIFDLYSTYEQTSAIWETVNKINYCTIGSFLSAPIWLKIHKENYPYLSLLSRSILRRWSARNAGLMCGKMWNSIWNAINISMILDVSEDLSCRICYKTQKFWLKIILHDYLRQYKTKNVWDGSKWCISIRLQIKS